MVFSPHMQPLTEAMAELTGSGRAVMLQLSESWMREYQVRTQTPAERAASFGGDARSAHV